MSDWGTLHPGADLDTRTELDLELGMGLAQGTELDQGMRLDLGTRLELGMGLVAGMQLGAVLGTGLGRQTEGLWLEVVADRKKVEVVQWGHLLSSPHFESKVDEGFAFSTHGHNI